MNDIVKALDPYEELGVARNATEAEVKKAYREKAKTAHPDAGGDIMAWGRLQIAYDILTNPSLRKTYDDTGRIEEDRPDNDRAGALQIIEMHFGEIMNAYLLAGAKQKGLKDPRKHNLTKAIEGKITAEISEAEHAIPTGREVLAFFQDMKGRFTIKDQAKVGHDFLTRMVDDQIRRTEEQILGLEGNVRVRKLALEIVGGYDFRYDAPPPATERSASFDMMRGLSLDPAGWRTEY